MTLKELVKKTQDDYNELAKGDEDATFDNVMTSSLENVKALSPAHLAKCAAEALAENADYFSDVLIDVPEISGLNLAEEILFLYLMDHILH